jgi:hypothetical protein
MFRRRILVTIFITAMSVIAFGVLAINFSAVFVAGVLISGVAGAIALMAISCPKCGHTVLFQKQRLFGATFHAWSPFPMPTVCGNCGEKL